MTNDIKPGPKLDIDVGVKVSAELDSRSTGKITDVLIDVFSPVSESLGLVGDYIRIFRADVAARITRRTKELADESGIALEAPPVKFLLPFYEKSSCETDDELEEMWAKLLLAAGGAFDIKHISYIDIISRMSGDEARNLRELAKRSYSLAYPFEMEITEINLDNVRIFAKKQFPINKNRLYKQDFYKLDKAVADVYLQYGKLLWYTVPYNGGTAFQYPVDPDLGRDVFWPLAQKNLVSIERARFSDCGGAVVSWVEATPLGIDFINALEGSSTE